MRKICMTNHTNKYIQAEPFLHPRKGKEWLCFFLPNLWNCRSITSACRSITSACRSITSAAKSITSAAKSMLLPFRQKNAYFLIFTFYFLLSRNFFVRNLTKVTWYSLIPVFMRLHASDLSLRYLTYTSLIPHLQVTSSMYKMLSLLSLVVFNS